MEIKNILLFVFVFLILFTTTSEDTVEFYADKRDVDAIPEFPDDKVTVNSVPLSKIISVFSAMMTVPVINPTTTTTTVDTSTTTIPSVLTNTISKTTTTMQPVIVDTSTTINTPTTTITSVFTDAIPTTNATTTTMSSVLTNTTCLQDLKYVNDNLDKDWANRMMDSSTHADFSHLKWKTFWAGNLDYCRTVTATSDSDPYNVRFGGKYCYIGRSAKIINGQTLYLTTDACLPDTCSPDDIHGDVMYLLEPWLNVTGLTLNWTLTFSSCRDITHPITKGAIVMLFIIFLLVLLVISGTAITITERYQTGYSRMDTEMTCSGDGLSIAEGLRKSNEQSSLLNRKQNRCLMKFLKCFCAITNTSKIFDVKQVKAREPLLCLHGIRFIAMTWVILIHTYNNTFTLIGEEEFRKSMYLMNDWAFQIIIQASFAVDTFFFISGFLVTHIFLREMKDREGKISWIYFYLHRYWRLTPTYMLVLGFHVALVPTMYTPFFVRLNKEVCKWWVNLFYLNNIIEVGKACMSWTWYLANDMQFYVISPIFLYPLFKWPKFGLTLIFAMLCGSCLVCGILTYQHDLIPGYTQLSETTNFTQFVPRSTAYFVTLYNKPYARIQPYLVGVLIAYVFTNQIDKNIVLTPCSQILGWISVTAIALIDVYGVHGTNPDIFGRSMYNAFTHLAFSVALAWVVYVCLKGYGGIVNMFLSHDMFLPLSRLTYCAYLLHPVYMLMYYNVLRTPFYMNHLTLVTLFFSFFFVAYCMALVAALLIESPMMALEKMLLATNSNKEDKTPG